MQSMVDDIDAWWKREPCGCEVVVPRAMFWSTAGAVSDPFRALKSGMNAPVNA